MLPRWTTHLWCLAWSPPLISAVVNLIIDTDLSVDVDDVGALCISHALADLGEANILAIVHDTGLETGVGGVSVINRYYRRANIPVGAYRGIVGTPPVDGLDHTDAYWTHNTRGVYVDRLVSGFPSHVKNSSQVPDAVTTYKDALRTAEPHSVTVVSIGHATVLVELLRTASGRSLIEQKVVRMVMMGGWHHPKRDNGPDAWHPRVEWNFGGCGGGCGAYDLLGSITNQTLTMWPSTVPITFVGFEAAVDIHTGLAITYGSYTPCSAAYSDYCGAMGFPWCDYSLGGRASWDPLAVLIAVRPDRYAYLNLTREYGAFSVDGLTGASEWAQIAASKDSIIVVPADIRREMAHEIDELLLQKPQLDFQPPSPPPPPPPLKPSSPGLLPSLPVPHPPSLPFMCNSMYCTSPGDDCCAPRSLQEKATCSHNFVPIISGGACQGWSEGAYLCCTAEMPPPSPLPPPGPPRPFHPLPPLEPPPPPRHSPPSLPLLPSRSPSIPPLAPLPCSALAGGSRTPSIPSLGPSPYSPQARASPKVIAAGAQAANEPSDSKPPKSTPPMLVIALGLLALTGSAIFALGLKREAVAIKARRKRRRWVPFVGVPFASLRESQQPGFADCD